MATEPVEPIDQVVAEGWRELVDALNAGDKVYAYDVEGHRVGELGKPITAVTERPLWLAPVPGAPTQREVSQ